MPSWTTTLLLTSAVALTAGLSAPATAEAAPSVEVQGLADRIRTLVVDERPESADELRMLVEHGLPPVGLAVLLDAARGAPRVDLHPVLSQLSEYRRPEIRARAFVARAELGGHYADRAVRDAADDLELGVRRLAVVLGRANPSPITDVVVADLLEQDGELAAEFAVDGLVPLAGPPAPEPEEEEQEEEEIPFYVVDPGTPEPIVPDPLGKARAGEQAQEPEQEQEPGQEQEQEPEQEQEQELDVGAVAESEAGS